MESMTGFGRAVVTDGGISATVEVRGVNQKTLDLQMKLPPVLFAAEQKLREICRRRVSRGRVELFASYQILSPELVSVIFSEAVVKALHGALKPLASEGVVSRELTPSDILSFSEIFSFSPTDGAKQLLESVVLRAAEEAFDQFSSRRKEEGGRLLPQFVRGTEALIEMARAARGLEQVQRNTVTDNFRKKVSDLVHVADPAKLEQEAVLAAEKVDVSEELTRLISHLEAFSEALRENGEAIGKKLDFLLQEMQREVSTLLAKSALIELTRAGLEMRGVVEQLREQVNNVA
jgi:uncharacterized protein (TIGR00255 family)